MIIHVLLFDAGKDSEGIHSLELSGKTLVLMFENKDDAERYSGLLEAQDFPCPSVEAIERDEIELFCKQSGYEACFVSTGFIPTTDEERLMLVPPEQNRNTDTWDKESIEEEEILKVDKNDLDEIRKRFEGLL